MSDFRTTLDQAALDNKPCMIMGVRFETRSDDGNNRLELGTSQSLENVSQAEVVQLLAAQKSILLRMIHGMAERMGMNDQQLHQQIDEVIQRSSPPQ